MSHLLTAEGFAAGDRKRLFPNYVAPRIPSELALAEFAGVRFLKIHPVNTHCIFAKYISTAKTRTRKVKILGS